MSKLTPEQEAFQKEVLPVSQRVAAVEAKVLQLSKDFIESHDGIQDMVESKFDKVEALINASMAPPEPINAQIYTALAKAQLEIRNAEKNVDNEFTKKPYADLASVLDAVRGPLAKNGIALFQPTFDPSNEGEIGIHTILAHESGEYLRDTLTMYPPKQDPQGIGSCRTYMRRYSLMAMTGIAGAADDDAESTKADASKYERITADEAEKVLIAADDLFGKDADSVVHRMLDKVFSTSELTVSAISDLPAGLAEVAITKLKNQAAREKEAAKKKTTIKEQAG